MLQFGHGCGAVEINSQAGLKGAIVTLQFGHGCGAVEMQREAPNAALQSLMTLQFGHGCGAVEMKRLAEGVPVEVAGFNSATAAEPWRYVLLVPVLP